MVPMWHGMVAVPFIAKRMGPWGIAGMAIGAVVVGRIMKEEGDLVAVAENPLAPAQLTTINQSNIKSRAKYPVSAMPPALLYNLNEDEVLDLFAYLMSGGNPEDKAFKKQPAK